MTQYTYALSSTGLVQRSDGAFIPADPANTDYQSYLSWVGAGNTPTPAPASSLASQQATQWAAIMAERDRRVQTGGYQVQLSDGAKWVQSDPISRIQHLGLARLADRQLAAGGALTDALLDTSTSKQAIWKAMDGTFVALLVGDAENIFMAASSSDAALFGYAETLHAEVLAAANPMSINVLAGWPKIYGE